jgi:hypothetical protein
MKTRRGILIGRNYIFTKIILIFLQELQIAIQFELEIGRIRMCSGLTAKGYLTILKAGQV